MAREDIDISVVVPVYNGASDLIGCLASIAEAVAVLEPGKRDRIEIVVCDNHSPDGSLQIAREADFGCPKRVVQPPEHEENRTKNWSFGLDRGRGRWLMMLHHDDLMAPEGLDAQLRLVARSGIDKIVMMVGRHRVFDDPATPRRRRPILAPPGVVAGSSMRERILPLHCPFVPFVLFRRSAYEAVGGLDPRWQLVQDWELWMRLLGEGDVLLHRREVAWWREHPTSASYRRQNAREHVELTRSLRRSIPSVSSAIQRRAEAMAIDRAALQLADVGDSDLDWLAPDRLPSPVAAASRQRRTLRRIALELAVLRLSGAMRSWVAVR